MAFPKNSPAPKLHFRDGPFPKVEHLLSWDPKWRTDKAWMVYLSTPVWQLDQIKYKNVVSNFVHLHAAVNTFLRRFWIRRPTVNSVDRRSYQEGFSLKQQHYRTMPNVVFGAKLLLPANKHHLLNFSLLTRFLILNQVTGAVHLFRVRFHKDDVQNPFYHRIPAGKLRQTPLCPGDREDTVGYIQGYILHAYAALRKDRKPGTSVFDDVLVMNQFWKQFFNEQDTTLFCLELEQRFLFFSQLKSLKVDLEHCSKYIGKSV